MIFFLKEHLNIKGMSSVTLAEKVGVTKATISHWVTGTYFPNPDKLKAIADALGIKVWELFKDPTEIDNSECVEGKCPHCGKPLKIKIE